MRAENVPHSDPWPHVSRCLEIARARDSLIDCEIAVDDARRTVELAVTDLRTATRLRNDMAERLRRAITEARAA